MGRPRTRVAQNKKHLTKAERESRLASEAAHAVGKDQLLPPECLSARAKAEFERLIEQAHWLDNLDVNDLQLYCFYWDKAQSVMEEYDKSPEVLALKGADGMTKLVSNPLRKALREYAGEMRRISLKLGIASIDRLRLAEPITSKENKFLSLMR